MSWLLALRADASVRADWALALVVIALCSSASAARLLCRILVESTAELFGTCRSWLLRHRLLHHRHHHVLEHPLELVGRLVCLVGRLRIDPLPLHCGIRRVVVLEDLLGCDDLLGRKDEAGFDAGEHGTCSLPLFPTIPMPSWLGERRNLDRDVSDSRRLGFQG